MSCTRSYDQLRTALSGQSQLVGQSAHAHRGDDRQPRFPAGPSSRRDGPDYGRIYDHELVRAVQRIAGNGTGDTRWKVPGVLDWSTGVYNPRVDVTHDTTTLYASDRVAPLKIKRLPEHASLAMRSRRPAPWALRPRSTSSRPAAARRRSPATSCSCLLLGDPHSYCCIHKFVNPPQLIRDRTGQRALIEGLIC